VNGGDVVERRVLQQPLERHTLAGGLLAERLPGAGAELEVDLLLPPATRAAGKRGTVIGIRSDGRSASKYSAAPAMSSSTEICSRCASLSRTSQPNSSKVSVSRRFT